MEKTGAPLDVSRDVLHIPAQTRLTEEEVAKAVAHHNRHHPRDQRTDQPKAMPKSVPGKKMH